MRTDGTFHGSVTLAPVRAKALKQSMLCLLLPLQGVSYAAHYTQGVASLALGYELLSLRDVPAKTRPHRNNSPHAKNPCPSVAPTAHRNTPRNAAQE